MVREFQYNHLQVGLTYAQANGLTKFIIESFFLDWKYQSNDKVITIEKYLIACESHQPKDGDQYSGIHFHCYVKFSETLRARDTHLFDIEDIMGEVYHPHVEKIYGVRNMIKYCTKEDEDPTCNFNWKNKEGNSAIDWEMVYGKDYDSPKEFLDFFRVTYPGYYTNHYINLKQIAYDNYSRKKTEYVPEFTFFPNTPFAADAWVKNYLIDKIARRAPALMLIGATGTGKTEWARSIAFSNGLGDHMYFNGGFNLDEWNEDAAYIIIDDFDKDPDTPLERYFPSWKQFFGCQKEFTLTDKYRRKQKVKWGKPLIWISNNEINCKSSTLDYIKKNGVKINVYNDFY